MPESFRLKPLGYWRDTHHGLEYRVPVPRRSDGVADVDWDALAAERVPLPHPRILVDPTGCATDQPQVVGYLRQGWQFATYEGLSYCRFECSEDHGLGYRDLTDGEWVWPEGLAHYVERHAVRLPDPFLLPLVARDWRMPPEEEVRRRVCGFREMRRQLEDKGRPHDLWNSFDWSVWIAWAEAHDPGEPAEPDAASAPEGV